MIGRAAEERLVPKSLDELTRQIRQCAQESTPVRIEGGNTLRGMGAQSSAACALVMTSLSQLVSHQHHDLTCSVQSGMRVGAFADRLAEHGQFVPLDAPLPRRATVGGTVAAGWIGPRRHLYGRPRDLLIGTQAVLADGNVVNAGGMVVKNVSGYDMSKLYAGSFGTLAVLTQLNFKALPLPQRRRALLATLPQGTRADAVAHLYDMRITPAAALFVEGFRKSIDGEDGIDGRVLVLLEGSQALVDRATRELRTELGRAGVPETTIADVGASEMFGRAIDAAIEVRGERSITYRSLGAPDGAHQRATALRDAANARELYTDVMMDAMNGDVFIRLSDRDSRSFNAKVFAAHTAMRAVDSHAIVVACAPALRGKVDPWGAPPDAIERMRALKASFDPKNLLNPGRFVV